MPIKLSNFMQEEENALLKNYFFSRNNTLNMRKVGDSFVKNVCAYLSSNIVICQVISFYCVCILKHMIFLLAKKRLRSAVLFMVHAIGEDIAKIVANIFVFPPGVLT